MKLGRIVDFSVANELIMAALWPLYFRNVVSLSSFYLFPSPILSSCRSDVYHTSIHGVALV